MFKVWKLNIAIGFALLLPAAGCQDSQQPAVSHGEVIAPDSDVMTMRKIADAQANNGARFDATLYASHFDGQYLNSLGMAKLDRMLKDDADPPLAVWLAIPQDDKFDGRRLSVAAYLKTRGLSGDQISLAAGGNPDTDHPAADDLKNLSKTDTGSGSSSSSTGGSTASAAPGAGGSTPGQP